MYAQEMSALRILPFLCLAASPLAAQPSALDRYIAKPDPVYGWKLVHTIPGQGFQTHVLELTSQTWRTEKDVDKPVWKHWLTIVQPNRISSDKALLFIGSGNNNSPAPQQPQERSVRIAMETNSVVADLGMVPNQPLRFTDSPERARVEDDIIAYTRVKHFTTKDDTWLVRLAMVKSGVRAMDAIQAFVKPRVNQFVVAGASKRGWTTWLIGEADRRVVAIMPMVIDALNSEAITRHHFEALGFFSPSLKDYIEHGLFPHKIGTPEYRAVLHIEDPYEHRNRPRMRLPKFLINAAGDEFFLPDNAQFYYHQLPEEKHLRYVPNTKHNLQGSDAMDSMLAFYQAILTNTPRPRFTWKKTSPSELVLNIIDRPAQMNLWKATNPDARDFRLDVIGKAYQSTPIAIPDSNRIEIRVARPPKGYTAFFVEMIYPGPSSVPFRLTTEVAVTPDTRPFRFADAAAKYPRP